MKATKDIFERINESRAKLPHSMIETKKSAEEGGCGVTGFICSIPVSGRHIYEPSVQMHNRGNGKGGGIAAVGLSASDLKIPQDVLDSRYLLQVALLDPAAQSQMEKDFVAPYLDVYSSGRVPTVDDYRDIEGLEIKPPDVQRYFVRVKKNVLDRFIVENRLGDIDPRRAEDEFISQNSYRINDRFYASLGKKRAFVLSHGRDIMILKIVGYAEKVARYYLLNDFKAHGWIAHQRYPTRGRVWHPGGAHPFTGLNEALVHNGDFANYYSISEYLKQYNIFPQFLTDTEVSIQLFDLWNRSFGYPLEYIIEAMAPTTEHDFDRLPQEKQHIYRYIQQSHIHSSPDGPWFFIIARNDAVNRQYQLIGITDTAMLRPQVFAMQEGDVQIGFICSEKQAIDATLQSLAAEDSRFCTVADHYWNARGGSATDGGAFIFTVKDNKEGTGKELLCTNKFGDRVVISESARHNSDGIKVQKSPSNIISMETAELENYVTKNLPGWSDQTLQEFCRSIVSRSKDTDELRVKAIHLLTFINDRRIPSGTIRRNKVLAIARETLTAIFNQVPEITGHTGSIYCRIDWSRRHKLRAPEKSERILVVNSRDFPPEGDDCDSRLIVAAHKLGWKQYILFGLKGQRFTGCGFSSNSKGVRIDVYDSSGDYLASGIDGMEIYVHGNAQDQVGQIMKSGKLVIYGDVGQTFMYGAKGGSVYVMGNAAGRPLINAVGRPRVVINGTCLDYLAESFMAGDPLNGGGFVIMNGITTENDGTIKEQLTPYPGSNLFSLASGGAIYIRDPFHTVVNEQLNGGEIVKLTGQDWDLIFPYMEENERLFGITIDRLLTVKGIKKDYSQVYRKVQAVKSQALAAMVPVKPSPRNYADVVPEGEDADE